MIVEAPMNIILRAFHFYGPFHFPGNDSKDASGVAIGGFEMKNERRTNVVAESGNELLSNSACNFLTFPCSWPHRACHRGKCDAHSAEI